MDHCAHRDGSPKHFTAYWFRQQVQANIHTASVTGRDLDGMGGGTEQPSRDAPAVERTGYENFGSFHTGNVETLAQDDRWQPPSDPCALEVRLPAGGFGAPYRDQFLIDFQRWTFINHGAFGAVLRLAQREAAAWRERCEAQPLAFLDR